MPGVNPPVNQQFQQTIGDLQRRIRALETQQQTTVTNSTGQPIITLGLVPGSNPPQYGLQLLDPTTGNVVAFWGGASSSATTTTQTVGGGGSIELTGGGSLTVDGGDVIFKDTTGTVLFKIGAQTYGDRGVSAYRADGSVAWTISKIFSAADTVQRLQIYDESGRVIGGDAQLSPSGFDSPHIPLVWRPINRSDAQTLSSSVALNTWTSLFECRGIRGNPGVPFTFSVLCSDGTTAGNIQVIDTATGNPIAAFFSSPWLGSIPAGTTTETFITSPSLAIPGAANDSFKLQVQVERTAGTGTISLAIAQAVGGGL